MKNTNKDHNSSIEIKVIEGKELTHYLEALARLRITVFRDFPYLYDGDTEYEEKYLSTYMGKNHAICVLALHQGHVVGASTALPLSDETDEVKKPFIDRNINPEEVFYFGESVLEKNYRGRGLGVRFFKEREAYALELNRSGNFRFTICAFCAVQRPDNHPLRPENYVPLHTFWHRRGYTCHPDMKTRFSWKDLGESAESEKEMVFWTKKISKEDG
ncbi:hypothetical protein QLX67_06025 [Balneolaceae bacterium ANBcel3]|nr:hypothetical protein [Balneolaceae bacterium ANBcel3]